MATTKPTKPSITLPSAFGTSASNVKTPFTSQELIDGYSASIQQILDGGNVNWLNDTMFKYLTYTTAIVDWLNGISASKVPFINSSNQLDSATPVLASANNTFTGTNTFTTQATSDDSQKASTTGYVHDILEAIYPIGSVYLSTTSTCPLATFFGTWQNIGTKILTGASAATSIACKGNGNTVGFTNGTTNVGLTGTDTYRGMVSSTEFKPYSDAYGKSVSDSLQGPATSYTTHGYFGLTRDSTKSGIIADTSNILSTSSITVNIFKRTA